MYGSEIQSSEEFDLQRKSTIRQMGQDENLRSQALKLQISASKYQYGYQQTWCGVPIIRLPDDILALQEIMWETKPSFVVETGVARGGSLIFSASMMSLIGVEPMVLGLDIQILEHAISAIRKSRFRESIELWEGDSASNEARDVVKKFLFDRTHPGLLVLDSEHSHKHVLAELNNLGTLLPIGSIILVADTLIEELPSGYFSDRPWDKGNSPLTAINEFLKEDRRFTRDIRWSRRSLVSEFRDGVLIKTS